MPPLISQQAAQGERYASQHHSTAYQWSHEMHFQRAVASIVRVDFHWTQF